MRRIIYKDSNGYNRCVLLRDEDDPNNPEIGIPVEPPPIERIVMDAALDVRNELVAKGILTWQDVVKSQNGVSSAIVTALRSRIINAYKQKEFEK